ncbi:type II toxin-antitoxin system PemK/MazF family toxin [Nonomuraea sp. SMC257]|uniref:Type II toxin-antitoxin system PemK/MazF family toxin n=1 Tax=Nonomuraea montanisoli TaxID=2741721 RepID=A0A7Y6M3K0_9ACTN|nr:type II toxin-antitoxin system PemK/MazF family toxin [Nonomuraea montanisoli]NUW32566.1 type II toxin-antitoxin system PemK/MazF family toxin [Nonomuraea montanisoli]
MIRGAIYRVDLGQAERGHEQRGRRFGLVVSPSDMSWTVATIIPTSGSAQPTVFRPEIEFGGRRTRLLVDQIRTIDTSFVHGEPVYYLGRDEMAEVERAVMLYLGL